jgi:trimethylamine--corrinoid protein Co-methyltransferase
MATSSTLNCTPGYRLLSPGQIDRIHAATLELLETVGVHIRHQGARDMMAEAGCTVRADGTVLIPGQLVADAIDGAPASVIIYNRLGKKALQLEGRRCHFGLGTDLAKIYDLDTGRIRESTLKDVQSAVRIADALAEIDFIASYVIPNDSPSNLLYLDAFKSQLEYSTKPIFFTAAGFEDIDWITEMAAAVAGGRDNLRRKPFLIHYSEPISPLTHSTAAVDKLLFCADHHIPVTYTPGMMSGASGPVTLAGALAMGNAEALSGLVMHQLRSRGAPIISGIAMAVMDMVRTTCIYGCPESRLVVAACADLYRHYGVPMWGTAGTTDAHCLDLQAGMEWGGSLLTNAMAGVNLIHDVGYMGQGLVGHPAALVICAEMISYTKRFLRGFELDEDHLDLDTIRAVGAGGSFLTAPQTARLFRSEHWQPNLCNRDSVGSWQEKGAKDMAELAVEKVRDIIRSHPINALDASVHAELDRIRSDAANQLKDIQFRT